MKRSRHLHPERGGFALMIVLLVLLALLVLCTPFLLSAKNADKASMQLADRNEAKLALDAASLHMRAQLGSTYKSPDLDATPDYDSLPEIAASNAFPDGFLDANDPKGAKWDAEITDVAGLIDLNSASPHVIANLMGLSTRFADVIKTDSKILPIASTQGLEPSGFLVSQGEIIRYTKIVDSSLTEFVRGVLGPAAERDKETPWLGGPRPTSEHGIGAPVIDQRAFAPCAWRIDATSGDLRPFAALEELPQCGRFALAAAVDARGTGVVTDELLRPLFTLGTVHAGPRAGRVWQRAARVTTKIEGGKHGRMRVDNGRWFNAGSTVRITDGRTAEVAIVSAVLGTGEVVLDRILKNDYEAYDAVMEVLARRPVNLNTARVEVLRALFSNLQVVGKNARITYDEASQLADIVVQSRPFKGFEDFLTRLVLPAGGIEKLPADAPVTPAAFVGGQGIIDPWDAVALYRNGLNANDAGLAYSTMPYSFTTRDTYALELRASVNAESGVERCSLVRDEVLVVAPQQELTRQWQRQEDFDEELRLTCEAPWWMTGPHATSRYDGTPNGIMAVPPSRLSAHLGTAETKKGTPFIPGVTDPSALTDGESAPTSEHVFASRDDQAWIQLMPTRTDEMGQRKDRVLHFDHETKDLEGRYLPDQVVAHSTDDLRVRWTIPSSPLLRSPSLSFWIKPRSLADCKLLDIGGPDASVDRISLQIEGADLVLRVIDGFGDHKDTAFKEFGELRFAVAPGNSPGIPADVWTHIELDVRGNRPSQMNMLVNGLACGVRTPGLTRLTGALNQNSSVLAVESTEGFPETCTVRVGNELIEVRNAGSTLQASRQETGVMAGFGGRMAREQAVRSVDGELPIPVNLAILETQHPAGTPVELYGYAMPFSSDVPTGKSQLGGDLGRFRVALLRGVHATQGGAQGEPIQVGLLGFTIGYGMKGANSTVSALELGCADDGDDVSHVTPPEEYMTAFHRDGGYAIVVQDAIVFGSGSSGAATDNGNSPIGGVEIIRYSGWSGTTLQIAQRGITKSQLPNLAQVTPNQAGFIGGQRSFIATWRQGLMSGGTPAVALGSLLYLRTYVIPISLAVPGAGDVSGFLAARKGDSRFAQITHISDAENTEWVRYDWFDSQNAQLVRDDPDVLGVVWRVVTGGQTFRVPDPTQPGGGGPGGPPGPGGGTGGGTPAGGVPAGGVPGGSVPSGSVLGGPAFALASPTQSSGGASAGTAQWEARIGQNENTPATAPLTRAVETYFQFRGVLGTYSHKHPSGTSVLPVFMAPSRSFDGGRPGRLDAVFLSSSSPNHIGWPLRVHRAIVPATQYGVVAWQQSSSGAVKPLTLTAQNPYLSQDPYLTQRCWIALEDRCPEPILAGSSVANTASNSSQPIVDSRLIARMVCFPSGERPRAVNRMAIGGGAAGAPGAIPSAVVDEIVLGDAQFGRGTPGVDPEAMNGATLVLTQDLGEGETAMRVAPRTVRVAISDIGSDHPYLADMPQDGGLLRVGEEIMAYKLLAGDTGDVTLGTNARGLLGTRAQAHQLGEPVMFLEHTTMSVLSGPIGAMDAKIGIVLADEFPAEGTVLIGQELIHYTRLRGNALEMPRTSSTPGQMDGGGEALFRGRYGTLPAGHAAGEPVILFPTRYLDRWAKRADAPELSYFAFEVAQPAAYFSSFSFTKVNTPNARLGVLARTKDGPWDGDPDADKSLVLDYEGEKDKAGIPLDVQSDHVEWRVFVEYLPGAFDAKTGLAHGWKQSPRLKLFKTSFHAPSMVLRSVER